MLKSFLLITLMSLASLNLFAKDVVVEIEELISMNKDWRPSNILIEDIVSGTGGKISYVTRFDIKDSPEGFVVSKAFKDDEEINVKNMDGIKFASDEENFFDRNNFSLSSAVKDVELTGEVPCDGGVCELYRFFIQHDSNVFKSELKVAKEEMVILEANTIALMPFKREGADINSFRQVIKYSRGGRDSWYPIYKKEISEFEMPKFMFKWKGVNSTTYYYSGYKKGEK